MKLFNKQKSGTFRKIFIAELILIFSLLFSYAFHSFVPKEKNVINTSVVSYKNLAENYKILDSFLKLRYEFTKKDTKEKISRNLPAEVQTEYITKELYTLLKKKKYRVIKDKMKDLNSENEYLQDKVCNIRLQILYNEKKNSEFTELYRKCRYPTTIVRLMNLKILIKKGDKKNALKVFKDIFRRVKYREIKKYISAKQIKSFFDTFTEMYWADHFRSLLKRKQYSRIRKEYKLCRFRELGLITLSEVLYRKKRYSSVIRYSRKIKEEKYRKTADKLLFKIKLRRKELTDIYTKIKEFSSDTELYREILYDAATLLKIQHSHAVSLKIYKLLINLYTEKKLKKDNSFYKAVWLSTWLAKQADDMEWFSKCLSLLKAGNDRSYKSAASFWNYKISGTEPKYTKKLPFSYYYTRIKDIKIKSNTEDFFNRRVNREFRESVATVKKLISEKHCEEAVSFIKLKIKPLKRESVERNMYGLILAVMYTRKESYYNAFMAIKRNVKDYRELVFPIFLREIIMPVRYSDTVIAQSRLYGLDPLLVLSLIKQESFFNPVIKSYANAYGLMQLIYPTARSMARKLRINIYKRHLVNPVINIKLGTKYLSFLMKRYNNNIVYVLGAYNAGEHRMDEWTRKLPTGSDELFIENIPFTETRNYIKSILRNYSFYRHYYKNDFKI